MQLLVLQWFILESFVSDMQACPGHRWLHACQGCALCVRIRWLPNQWHLCAHCPGKLYPSVWNASVCSHLLWIFCLGPSHLSLTICANPLLSWVGLRAKVSYFMAVLYWWCDDFMWTSAFLSPSYPFLHCCSSFNSVQLPNYLHWCLCSCPGREVVQRSRCQWWWPPLLWGVWRSDGESAENVPTCQCLLCHC